MEDFQELTKKVFQLQEFCKVKLRELEGTKDTKIKEKVWSEITMAETELLSLYNKISLAYVKPIGNA